MDDSTPISQLMPNMQTKSDEPSVQNTMSYSDVLQDLENNKQISQPDNMVPQQMTHQQQDMSMMQQPMPPNIMVAPQHATQSQHVYNKKMPVETPSTENEYELFGTNMQNDIVIIMIAYVLLHSDFIQQMIKTKFPQMYNMDSSITTFGTIFHAVLIVVILYVGKYLKTKHLAQ